MFKRGPIIVLGNGDVAERVAETLTNCGQKVRRVCDNGGSKRTLRSAETLLLAEPDIDLAAAMVARIAEVSGRHPQTRLYLGLNPEPEIDISDGEGPWRYLCWPRVAARILFQQYPLHFSADVAAEQAPRLLILGFGAVAQAIVLQAMRLGHYGCGRLAIDVLCRTPDHAAKYFTVAFPQAYHFCDINFHPIEGASSLPGTALSAAYVSLENDHTTEKASLRLIEQLRRAGRSATPVLMMLDNSPATAPLEDWDGTRYPFVPLTEVCRHAVLPADPRDALAKIVHNHYQDSIASQNRNWTEAPAAEPWESLDESYREASRNQSDHVSAKLALIHCRAATGTRQGLFIFNPDDVEHLARIEHQRWAADRYLAGWTHAPQRDNRLRHHPDLIPFDELSEPTKDLDRFAVRLLPALLGRSELSVQQNLSVLLWIAGDPGDKGIAKAVVMEIMQRLQERFPDHCVTLLCRLASAAERSLVDLAMQQYGAALRVLFPAGDTPRITRPASRLCYLRLLAGAECRYAMDAATPSPEWLARQVDVICTDTSGLAHLLAENANTHPRVVELQADLKRPCWHFEY